jgi:type I site-specific restriction endonuclease
MVVLAGWLAVAGALAAEPEREDPRAKLIREEDAQKRARAQTQKALREFTAVLEAVQAHRLKPTGELIAAPAARDSLRKIDEEELPKLEKELYLARSNPNAGAGLATSVEGAAKNQAELIARLDEILTRLNRATATGACLHRAERILRDQIELDGQAKPALREGFGKALTDLAESLRRKLVGLGDEELRIGREVDLLDRELAESERTGPAKQKPGIAAARKIVAEKKLTAAALKVAEQLGANNAAAAAGGQELETCFKALVAALQAATAGAEEVAPFDLLGPSLADLAAKDKELKELLDKLKAMIKEAGLLAKKPEREELRRLQNMQEELNNMLVEVSREMPELEDAKLIEKLKELLKTALADMARAGEAINKGEDAEQILEELKVSLGHIVLAEAELQALLATLAALSAQKQAASDDKSKETPAGIALGLGLRLGGNQTGASGPGGVLNPGQKARDLGPQDWGRLPPAVREQLLQAAREAFPQEYEDLIELYFQNIAKGAK